MKKVITVGEAMGLFVADNLGPLEEVNSYTRYTAGAEMNVAIGLARLEQGAYYATQLGNDPMGRYVKTSIANENINTDYIYFSDKALTGLMFKERTEKGDPLVASYRKGSAATHFNKELLGDADFSQFDHIHLAGIFLGLSETTRETSYYFLEMAKKHGIRLTFDPNLRPGLWRDQAHMIEETNRIMCQCEIVLPGLNEGQLLTGLQTEEEVADYYLGKGVKAVIIKIGGDTGAYVKTTDTPGVYVPGYKVTEVIDTVGAGDGFAVGVISALMDGESYEQAAERGCAIGAIQVTSLGDNDGLPDRAKLKSFMSGTPRSK